MCEYLLRSVKKVILFSQFEIYRGRLKGAKKIGKYNSITVLILVLIARLFFLSFLDSSALAKEDKFENNPKAEIIDPLEKIGKGIISKNEISPKNYSTNLDDNDLEKQKGINEIVYNDLLVGYPMEEMVAEISKKDKTVAAFLISIAKKESDWGRHSPKKNGRDCYNYWGYKGSYNLTNSGYSCFDSSEHAVSVVGGRIADLIDKKINTPEKMVIWKCGSDCSWDNPVAVRKWISDVSKYYHKLNS